MVLDFRSRIEPRKGSLYVDGVAELTNVEYQISVSTQRVKIL